MGVQPNEVFSVFDNTHPTMKGYNKVGQNIYKFMNTTKIN